MACCPSIWWCSPSGPVEVAAAANGSYARPPGATGHPFRSYDEALVVCPTAPSVPILTACNATWNGSPSPLLSPLVAKLNWNYPGSAYAGRSFYGAAVWNDALQRYDVSVEIPDEPGGGINSFFGHVPCSALATPAPTPCLVGDRLSGGISANWPNFGGSLIALGSPSTNVCMTLYTTSPLRMEFWLYDASWWTLEIYQT